MTIARTEESGSRSAIGGNSSSAVGIKPSL
jgi:hypothetical protein